MQFLREVSLQIIPQGPRTPRNAENFQSEAQTLSPLLFTHKTDMTITTERNLKVRTNGGTSRKSCLYKNKRFAQNVHNFSVLLAFIV